MILALLVAAVATASPAPAVSAPLSPAPATPAASAPTGAQPPDGTYNYQGVIGSQPILQATVVVKRSTAGVDVKETETAAGMQGSITTTADMQLSPDLRPTGYDAIYGVPGGKTVPAKVTFSPNAASEQAKGQTLALPLAPNTSRFAIVDGALLSGFLLLPAQMYGQKAVTALAPVVGFSTALSPASDNPARPQKLPNDVHLSITGPVPFVEWYDPTTYVVDEIDVPTQNLTVTLRSHTSATAAPATSEALPNSTPVPLGAERFRSSEVSFLSADGTRLAGTVSPPNGKHGSPGVLLIVGSGPVDRDERIGPNLIFAQIAHALGNAGFAYRR